MTIGQTLPVSHLHFLLLDEHKRRGDLHVILHLQSELHLARGAAALKYL